MYFNSEQNSLLCFSRFCRVCAIHNRQHTHLLKPDHMETFRQHVPSPLPLRDYLGVGDGVGIEGLLLDDMNPFQACEIGSFTHVSAFLLGGVDPNTSTMRGVSLLHFAARGGHALIVRFLIDNGASVDPADNEGLTPLMYACVAGEGDTIKMLVDARADTSLKCRYGHSCYYYASSHHIAFHHLVVAAPMPSSMLEEEELLHQVASVAGNRFSVLYLIEQLGADPNTKSTKGSGGTPLHAAALAGDLDVVKALVSKGADATLTDGTGFRPANQPKCPSRVSRWLKKYLAEPSQSRRQQLALPDFSNWETVLNPTELRHFLFYFTFPHWMIVLGSYIHPLAAFVGGIIAASCLSSVASFGLKQKNRSICTAGFFTGGIAIAIFEYVRKVKPIYDEDHPGSWMSSAGLVLLFLAMVSYFKTIVADPGCAQSTAEQRREFYSVCHRASDADAFDQTAMVRKPLRSKHCTKTHQCVKRFDHFCVWTGNAVGAGNHRTFILFVGFCMLAHIPLSRVLFYYFFEGGASSRQLYPGATISTLGDIIGFLFSDENIIPFYFGVFYNLFSFMFTGIMTATHVSMMLKNMTSNENWFPQRYTWIFKIGDTHYNLFDEGPWANVKSFWFGDLGAEIYENPKMNDRLKRIVNAFTEKVKKQQSQGGCGDQSCQDSSCGVNAPLASTVQPPIAESAVTIDQLPTNKKLEVTITQMLFTQLLQGASDPQPPADCALSPDRARVCVEQAHAMLAKYKERMNSRKLESSQPAHEDRKRH